VFNKAAMNTLPLSAVVDDEQITFGEVPFVSFFTPIGNVKEFTTRFPRDTLRMMQGYGLGDPVSQSEHDLPAALGAQYPCAFDTLSLKVMSAHQSMIQWRSLFSPNVVGGVQHLIGMEGMLASDCEREPAEAWKAWQRVILCDGNGVQDNCLIGLAGGHCNWCK